MCSFSRCCCMYVSIAVLCGFHFRYKKKNNPATSPHPQKHTYYRGNNNTKTVDSSNVSLRKWWWNKFAWNIKTFLTVTAPVSLLPQNFPELLLLLHLRGTWGRSTEKVAPLACCMMYFFFASVSCSVSCFMPVSFYSFAQRCTFALPISPAPWMSTIHTLRLSGNVSFFVIF